MSLYIDLSEFLVNPIRTGIQRISGEICRNLPLGSFTPVRLSSDGYVALPGELTLAIAAHFDDSLPGQAAEIHRWSAFELGVDVRPSETDIVLVPEVFDNATRLNYFRTRTDEELKRYRFIVYDLLPITHPELFISGGLVPIYRYYQLLRRATGCGFISDYTRDTYNHRLKRKGDSEGKVLPLGSDALGQRGAYIPHQKQLSFTVLGTVEPRKNHELILNAFEPLLGRVEGLTLSFVGRMGWIDAAFADRINGLAANPNSGFKFFPAPEDGTVRHCIENSRATIYVSVAEGYGLPPVESLWLGTPVIASNMVPSLARLGTAGIYRVESLDVISLRRAVLRFVDDTYSCHKRAEALSLNLPTWRSFAEDVLDWCSHD